MFVSKKWLSVISLAAMLQFSVAEAQAAETVMAKKESVESADYLEANDDYLNSRPADANDPIEGFNRGTFAVNKGIDMVLIKPVSQAYDFIVPTYGQHRVTNFLDNLGAPVVFLNSVLQANPENSFVTLWRFILNSSLGVAGVFDIATHLGVPQSHDEDFGQTLAHWGAGGGAYIVLPLFGASNVRDTIALPINIFSNPFTYIFNIWNNLAWSGGQVVDARTRFAKIIDQTYETSVDPYATFRSLYLQRRGALILNQRVDVEQSVEMKK